MSIKTFFDRATLLWGYGGKPLQRFLRYTISGTSSTALDFLILIFLFNYVGIHYLPAAAISFLLATTVHYTIIRRWAFSETLRKHSAAYPYFIAFAAINLLATLLLLAFFVETLSFNILLARFIAASLVGIFNYLANLYLTFEIRTPNGNI